MKDAMGYFDLDSAYRAEIDENRKVFVDQFFYKIDGNAGKRILSRIGSEMESKI